MSYSDNPSERPLLSDDTDELGDDPNDTWRDDTRQVRSEIPEPSVADSEDLQIRSVSPSPMPATPTAMQLPLWLREASPTFHWAWVPLPVRRTARFVADWTKGPKTPQIQRIQPWAPSVQEFPLRLVDWFLPRRWHKGVALLVLYVAWALTFALVIRDSARSGDIEGYGPPANLWCGASLWYAACTSGQKQGLD